MGKYVISVDQSTQGTKALLLDKKGAILGRSDLPHQQIIGQDGWVSHDPEEIYRNLLQCVKDVVEKCGVDKRQIACMGISNQRETSVAWDRDSGKPVCDAIVWQCARAKDVCQKVIDAGYSEVIQARTGIPISPYFPASKLAWILENVQEARDLAEMHKLCMGTVDAWLVYKLTGGLSYKTDFSNASRTQLFNLLTLTWDAEICGAFGLDSADLPEVTDSDSVFGMTDFEGYLSSPIPICGVMGDSHAALFGQGCLSKGMAKATYGTGSSIMMNIGKKPIFSKHGLVTSLAWKRKGVVQYVMEGNINYTGAVISWMQKDLGLIRSPEDTQSLAENANQEDTTYLVPAFTGLGAPYWDSEARAVFCGMSRITRRAELVKAGLESIAYQIADVVKAIENDIQERLPILRVDGGPTRNAYLMQFQCDMLDAKVQCPSAEELSGIGAAYMAGLSAGVMDETIFDALVYTMYRPNMETALREQKYAGWQTAVKSVLQYKY